MSAAGRIDELIVIKEILTKYTGLAYINPINKEHRRYVNKLIKYHYDKFYKSCIKYSLPNRLQSDDWLKSVPKMLRDINTTMGLINQYFSSGMWSREKNLGSDISTEQDTSNDLTYIVFKGYNILYLEYIPTESEEDLDTKNEIIKHTRTFFRIYRRVFENKWQPKSDIQMDNIEFFLEN